MCLLIPLLSFHSSEQTSKRVIFIDVLGHIKINYTNLEDTNFKKANIPRVVSISSFGRFAVSYQPCWHGRYCLMAAAT